MHDANDLVRAVQQISNQAGQAGYPADIMSGTVATANPLKISVEQRFEIGKEQLIVPERFTDHKVVISLEDETEVAGEPEHKHKYGGKKLTVTVHGALKKGDAVALVRQQGGQKFLIADRVG